MARVEKSAAWQPPGLDAPDLAPARSPAELMPLIAEVLDAVDAEMSRPRTDRTLWSNPVQTPLKECRETLNDLTAELNRALTPRHGVATQSSEAAIAAEFGTAPGKVPSWARPGHFLLWLGPLPVHCAWGGFAGSKGTMLAVDTLLPWLVEDGLKSMYLGSIPSAATDVRSLFVMGLVQLINQTSWAGGRPLRFRPVALRSSVLKDLATIRGEHRAWLEAALEAGPTGAADTVEMPGHVRALQRVLFV
jgi:hypothetical protein